MKLKSVFEEKEGFMYYIIFQKENMEVESTMIHLINGFLSISEEKHHVFAQNVTKNIVQS